MYISKQGTPSNLIIELIAGEVPGSGAFNDEHHGGSALIVQETFPESDFSSTATIETLAFTDPPILPAGDYAIIIYQDEGGTIDSSNRYKIRGQTSPSNGVKKTRINNTSTSWSTTGALDLYLVANIESITGAAGNFHEYFFEVPRLVGTALSATELYLQNSPIEYAQGRITVSSTTPTTVTLGYAPRMVILYSLAGGGTNNPVGFSFGVVTAESQGNLGVYTDASSNSIAATYEDVSSVAWQTGTSDQVNRGSRGAVVMQEDGFIFGPTDVGSSGDMYVQWVAFS